MGFLPALGWGGHVFVRALDDLERGGTGGSHCDPEPACLVCMKNGIACLKSP